MERKIIGKECKFVFYLPAVDNYREDTHVVKETIHYDDGVLEDNLRVVTNFERPIWVTKEHFRTYKDKKETETKDRVNKHMTTQSNMIQTGASRLGSMYAGVKDPRRVKTSPYIYGLDIPSKTYLKHSYQYKYPEAISQYKVGVIDIEVDTIRKDLIIVSLAMNDKIYTVINKSFLLNKIAIVDDSKKLTEMYTDKLNTMYKEYIPKDTLASKVKVEYIVVDNEVECIKEIMRKAHEWKPDFMTVWNIGYDLTMMVDILEKNNVDPKDVFCDPDLPDNLKYFKYMEGVKQKTTASGKFKPVSMEEQWHWVNCPASFWWIDAMSTHRYVRVGGKSVPGGYSLDNILKTTLGDSLGKLKFKDEESELLSGLEWHKFMVDKRPLEYIIYNQWDVLSMLVLDDKTKDLCTVVPLLSGVSGFDIFHSGPKRIIENINFFYLENNRVLGTRPPVVEDAKLLELGGWIVALPTARIKDKGIELVPGTGLRTNMRMYVSDSD